MAISKKSVARRDVLKGGVAAAGLAAVSAVAGFPYVARAQGSTIRVGMPTILSGRVALLGTSSRAAAQIAIEEFNAAGGVNGKTIQLVDRDSKGAPDEAARVSRDLVNSDGCEILIDAEASSGSFAVQEVVRELPVLCVHTCSETSSLTADPRIRTETAFRCARQGIHDAVGGGRYAADIAQERGITRWMTCSPDYAYGRDNTAEFLDYLKVFASEVEVVDQAWPKLFEPDYTAFVTRILQVRPQAIYSALWGGDLVAFIEQGNLYGLFGGDLQYFSGGLADPPVVGAIKQVPAGLNSVYRYDANFPDNPANREFDEKYFALTGQHHDQLVVAELHRHAVRVRGAAPHQRRHRRQGAGGGDEGPRDRLALLRDRQDDHARRGPHDHRLPRRLGQVGVLAAELRRLGLLRLGRDPGAREGMEAAEGLHLILRRDPSSRHAPGRHVPAHGGCGSPTFPASSPGVVPWT